MPREPTETCPVRRCIVIQTRILSLEAIDGPVEADSFGADFRYQITGDVSLKTGGIGWFWIREEPGEQQWSDGWFVHCEKSCCVCYDAQGTVGNYAFKEMLLLCTAMNESLLLPQDLETRSCIMHTRCWS